MMDNWVTNQLSGICMKNTCSTVESQSLFARRQSAPRRSISVQGEHFGELSVIMNTVNGIKEVPTMPFYNVKSKIIKIL